MNFLQLCQRFRLEAGMTGTGPESVTATSKQTKAITDRVRSSWLAIQKMHLDRDGSQPSWRFLWKRETVETPLIGGGGYSEVIEESSHGFHSIIPGAAYIYLGTAGASKREAISILSWKDDNIAIKSLEVATAQKPSALVMRPDNALQLLPSPNGLYMLDLEGYRAPQVLSQNADEPLLSDEGEQMAIIYHALMDYGREENADEVLKVAPSQFAAVMDGLVWNQLDGLGDMAVSCY